MCIRDRSGLVMKDLTEHGQSFVAAKGGKGGKGNVKYTTSTRQAPNFAEAGGFAKERSVIPVSYTHLAVYKRQRYCCLRIMKSISRISLR